MQRSLPLVSLVLLMGSPPMSRAQDCITGFPLGPASTTTAQSTIDGPHGGNPAISSASSSTIYPGTNLGTNGALTIDHGYFDSTTHAGGFLLITGSASNSALVRAEAAVVDCLLMGGYAGAGVLHIPIHVTGNAFTEWSIAGTYQATPPDAQLAGNQLGFGCLVYEPQATFCTGGNLPIDQFTTQIDSTVELVFPFAFGTSALLRSNLNQSSSLGYSANGGEGTLTAMASLTAHGVVEPAYVTDAIGTPLPNTTITASSGFDYLHPVPEPSASGADAAVSLVLAALRRRARRARSQSAWEI